MEDIEIKLRQDEALVLFEFLSRFDDNKELLILDMAEEKALWAIHGALEKTLAEPFDPEYYELLAKARDSVKERWGE